DAGWTDWLATPGSEDVLWVVHARAPAALGLVLCFLFMIWALRARLRRRQYNEEQGLTGMGRGTLGFLLLCLGATSIVALWLPEGLRDLAWWPLAAAVVVALWWYLFPLSRQQTHKHRRRAASTQRPLPASVPSAGVLALFLSAWTAGPAAPPSDSTGLPPDTT